MSRDGDPLRVELYLRTDTYGTFDAQRRALERAQTLVEDDAVAALEKERVHRVQTRDEDGRPGALDTFEEFETWARRNGVNLAPAFQRRTRSYQGLNRIDEVVLFPVVSLAVYEGDRLRAVAPATGRPEATVWDCFDALETGGRDWLERYDATGVDRTTPLMAAGTIA